MRGIERPEEVWELVTADDPRLVTVGGLPSQQLPPALELLADASAAATSGTGFAGCGNGPELAIGWWQW